MSTETMPRTMLEFGRRAKHEQTTTANRRIWTSVCGCYRVVESKSLFSERIKRRDGSYQLRPLPAVYYACVFNAGCWDILSRHRKREPAAKACCRHAKTGWRKGEG